MDKTTNNSTGLMPVIDITNKPLSANCSKTENNVNNVINLTGHSTNSMKDNNLKNFNSTSPGKNKQNGITRCAENHQKQSTDIVQDLTILTDDVESVAEAPSSVISCHHISYRVEERKGKCGCGKAESRHILKNIRYYD